MTEYKIEKQATKNEYTLWVYNSLGEIMFWSDDLKEKPYVKRAKLYFTKYDHEQFFNLYYGDNVKEE